jgi:hypothetical protein
MELVIASGAIWKRAQHTSSPIRKGVRGVLGLRANSKKQPVCFGVVAPIRHGQNALYAQPVNLPDKQRPAQGEGPGPGKRF